MAVKLVAGLGNPGARYRGTRHNLGFRVLERLAQDAGCTWNLVPRLQSEIALLRTPTPDGGEHRVILVRPMTFMNLSGQAVVPAARYHRVALEDLLVVVDDVALPLGRVRFRARGSSGGHRGLEDIARALGGQDHGRLRIGIGPPRGDATSFVLARFNAEEEALLEERLPSFVEAIHHWVLHGMTAAMNRYNAADAPTDNTDTERTEQG